MSNKFDAEKELLEAVAKAKGVTLAHLLTEQGFTGSQPVAVDATVVFAAEPVPVIQAEVEAPKQPEASFVPEIQDFAPPPPAAPPEIVEEQKTDSIAPVCVHCGWDQRNPPLAPPDKQDKLTFIMSVLGQKVFTKGYETLGGKLKMAFRGLTVNELDALYAAAYAEQAAGRILNTQEYYDYLNRQRLFLQLQTLNASLGAMHINLPDGLSKKTNTACEKSWEEFLAKQPDYDAEEPLIPQIERYVLKHILSTEHLQRIVSHYCSKFNQLVAKLEVCIDDENFWNETVTQL